MNILDNLHADIGEHLDAIKAMFKDGAKITLIVRNPSLQDGDVVLSDDDAEEAMAAFQKLMSKPHHYPEYQDGPDEWESIGGPCRRCGAEGHIVHKVREDDRGHTDGEYHCQLCEATWFVDGIDS